MYGLLSKLILTKKLQFAQGKIIGFDIPFSFVPMVSLKQMTDDAINSGSKGITDLYFYGWVYGFVVTKNMIRLFNLKKFEERYKTTMDIIGVLGYGDYQTLSFKRGDYSKFKVLGNPFALLYHPSNKLVCHYIRGMEAGGGTLVHETLMDNIEFECAATNGQYCIHANLNQSNIDNLDKNLANSQIDRDYVKKRQKKLLEEQGYKPADFGF